MCSSSKWTTGDIWVQGNSNLVAGNIKKGVNIFGITGTYEMKGGELLSTIFSKTPMHRFVNNWNMEGNAHTGFEWSDGSVMFGTNYMSIRGAASQCSLRPGHGNQISYFSFKYYEYENSAKAISQYIDKSMLNDLVGRSFYANYVKYNSQGDSETRYADPPDDTTIKGWACECSKNWGIFYVLLSTTGSPLFEWSSGSGAQFPLGLSNFGNGYVYDTASRRIFPFSKYFSDNFPISFSELYIIVD